MEQFYMRQGLPPELLEALRTMENGGLLYAVEAQQEALVPCWVVRAPTNTHALASVAFVQTLRMVTYDVGPLAICTLALYERPHIEPVHGRGCDGVEMTPLEPFRLECFLHPAAEMDRLMLRALSESTIQKIEFYATDAPMSWQATKRYPLPKDQQHVAHLILHETASLRYSEKAFLAARDRFLKENPF